MTNLNYNVVVAGPGSVGKSAITLQFISRNFIKDYNPTIEEVFKKTVTIDGKVVYLDILDTAGQDEFTVLRSHHFSTGDGFLLVYSVDNRKAFEEISNFRGEITRAKDDENVPVVLIANKVDLDEERHEVKKSEGENLAKSFDYPFLETSAKKRQNVDEAFALIVREINKKRPQKTEKKKKKGCTLV